jgi:hypothetical protein
VLGSIVAARLPGLLAHASYGVAFTDAVHTAYATGAVMAVAATVVAATTLRAEPPGHREPAEARV